MTFHKVNGIEGSKGLFPHLHDKEMSIEGVFFLFAGIWS
jgi:hypothetical protein